MSTPLNADRRAAIKEWVKEALNAGNPAGWFETLYANAEQNPDRVPWARLQVNPHLQQWLAAQASSPNQSVLVIGCGLGDDAEAFAERGDRVTAFDISKTAIAWCQQRFPESAVTYEVADLFALDPAWREAFDLVYSSRTVQALPLSCRQEAIAAVVAPVALGGRLLLVTQIRDSEAEPDGPPWPLSATEIAWFEAQGLQEQQRQVFPNDTYPTALIEYRRSGD